MGERWLIEGASQDGQVVTPDWEFVGRTLIDGVQVKEIRSIPAAYGHLTEIFRRDWALDNLPVDQVFQAVLRPGVVNAWHAHATTTDRLFVSVGQVRVVLYDAREGSPTHGLLNEFRISSLRPALVCIPPRLWHGIQNMHHEQSVLLNLVDQGYSYTAPDHWRVPPDTPHIPYRFPAL